MGNFTRYNNVSRFLVARFNANGTLDSTKFDGLGGSQAYTVAIQPDGKILVGGYISDISGQQKAIYRFNSDGTLDPTFSSGITLAGGPLQVKTIAVQPDGKILIGGGDSKDMAEIIQETL